MSNYKNFFNKLGELEKKNNVFKRFFDDNKKSSQKTIEWFGADGEKIKKVKKNMSEWFNIKMLIDNKVNSNEYIEQLNKELSIFDLYEEK